VGAGAASAEDAFSVEAPANRAALVSFFADSSTAVKPNLSFRFANLTSSTVVKETTTSVVAVAAEVPLLNLSALFFILSSRNGFALTVSSEEAFFFGAVVEVAAAVTSAEIPNFSARNFAFSSAVSAAVILTTFFDSSSSFDDTSVVSVSTAAGGRGSRLIVILFLGGDDPFSLDGDDVTAGLLIGSGFFCGEFKPTGAEVVVGEPIRSITALELSSFKS